MRRSFLAVAALLSGCAVAPQSAGNYGGPPASALGSWRVTAVNGKTVADRGFVAAFSETQGSAQFGCNTGGGPVRLSQGWVVPGEWLVTTVGCMPKERMQFEAVGFDILSAPTVVTTRGAGIRLANAKGTIDLVSSR